MKKYYVIGINIAFLLLYSASVWAQPINDDCVNAIQVPAVSNWCSMIGEYTNVDATPSGYGPGSCQTNTDSEVWFSFVATATDLTVTVVGNQSTGSGGTLNSPSVVMYRGTCNGTINEMNCGQATGLVHITQFYEGGLIIGQTYLLRVEGANTNTGTFQLCINNYFAPTDPQSDCIDGSLLCDKSSFVVSSVTGAGNDNSELDDATCFIGGAPNSNESNSTWFKWICDDPGTLTFSLTPTNVTDDLDFVLYELPNGVSNCANKLQIRCMAAGENVSLYPSPCHGPTGLNTTATDVSEPPGCSQGQDNWISQINMQSGKAYALVVNNFTSTGNGFQVDFGGTGTFLGPEAEFTANPLSLCAGESVTLTDFSTFDLGTIVGYSWNFGVDAVPATATTVGPHNVVFESAGTKYVVLQVESSLGCIISTVKTIEVNECCDDENLIEWTATPTDLSCFQDNTGAIDVTVQPGLLPYTYLWNTGAQTEDLNGIEAGSYSLTITDGVCDTIVPIDIEEPDSFLLQDSIVMPTCDGGMDGAVFMTVSGATPPYQYSWNGGPFGGITSLSNLPVSTQTFVVRDANDCTDTLIIEVNELELELDSALLVVQDPACTGDANGQVQVYISNGLPPYLYNWGSGFSGVNSQSGLSAGTYMVTVQDFNRCDGVFTFTLEDPQPLTISIDSTSTSCFGSSDGAATPTVSGGVYPYTYSWNDSQSQNDSVAINLAAGQYVVIVTDNNGCTISDTTTVEQPPRLVIDNIDVTNVICYGDSSGQVEVFASGGTGTFQYSSDGVIYQSSSTLTGLPAGTYTIFVLDENDCETTQAIVITQPSELTVDAQSYQTVNLGETADLLAFPSTFGVITYQWSPPETVDCSDCRNVTVLPVRTTTYTVIATDASGCTASDTVTVAVNIVRPVFIPNAFTPNDDGLNDNFYVYGGNAIRQIKTFRVYDRWGELIFENENFPVNDPMSGWDGKFRGKIMNPAVFVYYTEVEYIDDYVEPLKGAVNLIR